MSRLDLVVQRASVDEAVPEESQIRRWLKAALGMPGVFTVRFVEPEESAELNEQYRQKPHATNVLTFPYRCEQCCEADLAICPAVVRKEAEEQGKSLTAHYAHLIVHGALHAQGFDHGNDNDADVMEAEEVWILKQLGFDDPYAV